MCSHNRSCILKPSGNKKERSERLQAMKKGITYNEESFEEDRRLVRLWKEGDRDAGEELLRKYDPLICREAASAREEDREDLRQELRLAFLEISKAYDEKKKIYYAYFMKIRLHYAKVDYIDQDNRRRGKDTAWPEGFDPADEKEEAPDMKDLLLFVKDLPLGPVERTLLDSILAGDPNNVQMKKIHKKRSGYYSAKARLVDILRQHKEELREILK